MLILHGNNSMERYERKNIEETVVAAGIFNFDLATSQN
jgi:hypothetical protein